MLQTLEAEIYPGGQIQFLEKFSLDHKVRAYDTILREPEPPKKQRTGINLLGFCLTEEKTYAISSNVA